MAIPVFRGRVAPVLDACTHLLVMDLEATPSSGRMVQVSIRTLPERVQEFLHLGISEIVCGALSNLLDKLLRAEGIHLICGIAGDIDAVVVAWQAGTLGQACFRMPGAGLADPREQSEP